MLPFTDDAFSVAHGDILDGVQFYATLHITTPLAVLEHHGEVFHGLPSQAPRFGDQSQGIWIPRLADRTFDLLGADATQASDVGSVSSKRYLPFLLAFRRIVEADIGHEEKLQRLAALSEQSPEFRTFWKTLKANYGEFPEAFFYQQLTALPGVGSATAKRLYEAGFRTAEAVREASVEELLAIPGIGPGLAQRVRDRGLPATAGEAPK